ncbi:MAG TPA: tRNA modification GTPase [Planctomycetaceae bacterium]|nr:tRNA modification GTPase [Planctomycetaceae bacterium]
MAIDLDDTIAALASPPGPAVRGIVRLSGREVRSVLDGWFAPTDPESWCAARRPMRHPGTLSLPGWRAPVSVAAHLWPTSRSYTGEPLAELHLPGSPPLLEVVLQTAFAHGARPARPGEFTLRAFLAGRLDLLQAEAVLGVIDAIDHRELAAALGQLAGGISHRLADLRRDLLELLADLEAGLDFVEEHLEFVARGEVLARLAKAAEFVDALLDQVTGRMHAGDQYRVVLAGLPNAGKSTLFNALIGADRALVSPVAGTTRDYLVADVAWSGCRLQLIDTAGWDDAADPIGAAMQSLRAGQMSHADLVVWCTAADAPPSERSADDELRRTLSNPVLPIVTKADIVSAADALAVSAITGDGLAALQEHICEMLGATTSAGRQWIGSTAARCQESLRTAADALHRAVAAASHPSTGDELVAVELRSALDHLGAIVGAVYTDDVLDRIFSKFCIGK